MSFTVIMVPAGEVPKRGDLVQTNVGDRRERTWFVLHGHLLWMRSKTGQDRFKIWRARWWELEPEMRLRLYQSAERRGGQVLWLPEPKPETAFENLRKKSPRK